MIEIKNLCKLYRKFDLGPINLKIGDGEYFVLLGKSGAGKSLLLECIAGLQKPNLGEIRLNGKEITAVPIQKRGIGFIFQNKTLFPHMTVEKNILFSANSLNAKNQKDAIHSLINALDITGILDRYPETLSVGESRRVAIARTLVTNPKYILMDEPLSALDAHTRHEIRILLRKVHNGTLLSNEFDAPQSHCKTIIHVTHDYEEALALASKVGIIENGKIVQFGDADDIFKRPKSEFVAKFVGIKNCYKGSIISDGENTLFTLKKNKTIKFSIPPTECAKLAGEEDVVIIKSENVILSLAPLNSSARNVFKGIISNIEKVESGFELEIKVDDGFTLFSRVTSNSYTSMNLKPGQIIFANFKASAVEFS